MCCAIAVAYCTAEEMLQRPVAAVVSEILRASSPYIVHAVVQPRGDKDITECNQCEL